MLKLKKTIDFNLLGDEGEDVREEGSVMDLDDDLSEETSPSPPPLKLARINISSSSPQFSSPPCSTPLSRLGQFFSSPSPTQNTTRGSRLFSRPGRKSFSQVEAEREKLKSSQAGRKSLRKLQGSVNTNPFTPLADSQTKNRKRQFYR